MSILRKLPKIDKLILNPLFHNLNPNLIAQIARTKIDKLREDILAKKLKTLVKMS